MPSVRNLVQKGIRLSPDLGSLSDVRDHILNAVAVHAGLSPEDPSVRKGINDMQLAATELVANVIKYGFPTHSKTKPQEPVLHPIHACAFVNREHQLVFQLTHTGEPFEGNQKEIKEVTMPMENGMGLYIISQCVDHVYYSCTDRGNYIWLFRQLTQSLVTS